MKLNVLSGGAAQGLVGELASAFHAATGLEIAGTFGAVGAMKDKLVAGEAADLMILSKGMIAELERERFIASGSAIDIGVVLTGIAVRAGDPVPAIGDAGLLRNALMGADAIYLPDPAKATAGVHLAKVLNALGIADEMAPRLRPFPHGQAAMAAMARHAGGRPIGCTQATEILATPGVVYAGGLPHEFELATVYTAAVGARAMEPDAARKLAEWMAAEDTRALRERLGFGAVA
jgi:molybdate transport system substrate-binding protein